MAKTAAKTAAKKSGTKKGNSKRQRKEPEGNHIRQLAPERAVRAFINEVIATKNRTSEIGQELSTSTKRATEQGINVPAARIAARLYSKAKQDAMKGRVLWEDTVYYLLECTDFEKIAPAGMFAPEEAGRGAKRQAEMPLDPAEEGAVTMDDVAEAARQETAH
jgi:hypothetical protein